MEKKTSERLLKEIKVVVHIPDKVSDRVKQRKINQIYEILAQKQPGQKAA